MAKKLHFRLPLLSTRATAIMSVALVLLILGLAATVGSVTHRITNSVRENMGFVLILDEGTTASEIESITTRLKSTQGVKEVVYTSPEVILDRWQNLVGDDEDIMQLAGINPFLPELEVKVLPPYAHSDSIHLLSSPFGLLPQVSDVRVSTELIDKVGNTLHSVSLTLIIIAVALLAVSFVLIFNTVRLTVYSRRFLINTMQLVGATPGFIRRPFLLENLLNGLIASVIACVGLGLILGGTSRFDPSIGDAVMVMDTALIMAAMVVVGIIICLAASLVACNRYLSLSYDQLFK
ncbi:MAG: hypothetical protein J1E29_05820 [Duncaniella sp.]|nr:hypothetical protein [Duncaniella sp.]